MTTLTVLKFNTSTGAEQMLGKIESLQKAELTSLEPSGAAGRQGQPLPDAPENDRYRR